MSVHVHTHRYYIVPTCVLYVCRCAHTHWYYLHVYCMYVHVHTHWYYLHVYCMSVHVHTHTGITYMCTVCLYMCTHISNPPPPPPQGQGYVVCANPSPPLLLWTPFIVISKGVRLQVCGCVQYRLTTLENSLIRPFRFHYRVSRLSKCALIRILVQLVLLDGGWIGEVVM